MNWYSYCGGNPVSFIDFFGLFDEDDRIKKGAKNNSSDVVVLQQALADRGYINIIDYKSGVYDNATERAINKYKEDNNLGNTGENKGVVGVQTWKSLGLIYRTSEEKATGVEIYTTIDFSYPVRWKQYKDYTKPINDAIKNAAADFYINGVNPLWFISKVNNNKDWDIKIESSWEKTIKTPYPGKDVEIVYNEQITTVEGLGNFTYGYLGHVAGYSLEALLLGGDYAAGGIRGLVRSGDSINDKYNIIFGYYAFDGYGNPSNKL